MGYIPSSSIYVCIKKLVLEKDTNFMEMHENLGNQTSTVYERWESVLEIK